MTARPSRSKRFFKPHTMRGDPIGDPVIPREFSPGTGAPPVLADRESLSPGQVPRPTDDRQFPKDDAGTGGNSGSTRPPPAARGSPLRE